jgi:hypothetical protein
MKDRPKTETIDMSQRNILIKYLLMKVETEDFHAVADAAMDLREIDAKLYVKVLK